MLGADTLRFRVVLPPTYASDVTTRFPTLYFLPGFDTPVAAYADGTFQGLRIDSLPAWAVTPFILVILDGDKGLGGGFYATSPVGGDWSAAVLQELVPAVDSRFRTLRSPAGSSPGIRWAERGRFSSAWGTPRCLHTCSP